MKVLIVSTFDLAGGAALAAYRLHVSLRQQGINSQMLVQSKSSDDITVIGEKTRLSFLVNRLRNILDTFWLRFYQKRSKTLFSTSQIPNKNIIKKINQINPDIVHLHWVCGGMMPIESLLEINSPIVWTFHDMWPITGGCHYTEECENFKFQCGNCKVLGSSKTNDLSHKIFKRKLSVFKKLGNLSIICSSEWMKKCTAESTLFNGSKIKILKNCINTKIFKPINKIFARNFFKIPQVENIVLFGAMNALSDPRKGAKEFFNAINMLDAKNTIFVFLVTFFKISFTEILKLSSFE